MLKTLMNELSARVLTEYKVRKHKPKDLERMGVSDTNIQSHSEAVLSCLARVKNSVLGECRHCLLL